MKKASAILLLALLVVFATAQINNPSSPGTTINPTNNAIPKRSNGTTFVDSSLVDNGTSVSTAEWVGAAGGFSLSQSTAPTAYGITLGTGAFPTLFNINSAQELSINATGVDVGPGVYQFQSTASTTGAAGDTGLSRTATGVIAAGNGTAGNATGFYKAAGFIGNTAFLTSLYTNATTTFSNVTNLSFAVAASQNYKIRCDLDYQSSATTADVKIQWTGPASPTFLTYDLVTEVTGSTLSASVNPATATTTGAFSTSLSESGTPTINTNFPMTLTMTLINGVNAGTVQLQAAATGVGTISILPGSCVVTQ